MISIRYCKTKSNLFARLNRDHIQLRSHFLQNAMISVVEFMSFSLFRVLLHKKARLVYFLTGRFYNIR